jgi:hypothetical protein
MGMGRIIEGQVVASTAVDRNGDQLTRAELRELFAQIPGERPLNLNHDVRVPPVGRAFNTRLDELQDGTLAVVSDIEVFDEEQFARVQGMSISFHRYTEPADRDSAVAPQIVVSYNPNTVDSDRLAAVLAAAGLSDGYAALRPRTEKSLLALGVILAIVSHGFFEEAGADAWRLFKRLVAEAVAGEAEAELAAIVEPTESRPQLVIRVPVGFDPDAIGAIDEDLLIEEAQALAPGKKLSKVVVAIDGAGVGQIIFAVDQAGVTVAPAQ